LANEQKTTVKQKFGAHILLLVFLGLSALPILLPDAPPQAPDQLVRITQFEDAGEGVVENLLRTASENQEENTRPNDFIFTSFISHFHSAVFKAKITECIALENSKRPSERIYLRHSTFLI